MDKMNFSINYEEICVNIAQGRFEYRGEKFEYIGEGASRRVFKCCGLAFKLAKNGFGLKQNEAEVDIFTKIEKDLEDLICPIEWFSDDYKVVVSKLAEPLFNSHGWRQDTSDYIYEGRYNRKVGYEKLGGRLSVLENKYELANRDIVKVSSWGMLDGVPVLIDYGYTDSVRYGTSFHTMYEDKILPRIERRVIQWN